MFGVQFYPTPENLVDKMIEKLNLEKYDNAISILDPSAGKGDIIEGFERFLNKSKNWYSPNRNLYVLFNKKGYSNRVIENLEELKTIFSKVFKINCDTLDEMNDYLESNFYDNNYDIGVYSSKPNENIKCEIDCIEIDKDLCSVLQGKHYNTINTNFLEYDTFKRYNVILMNPPFENGEMHLIKALKMLENGGQVVCILNAETLKNPYTNWRKELVSKLEYYDAEIEYIQNAFSGSERDTDVEIALINVNIPDKTIDKDILIEMLETKDYQRNYSEYDESQLATDDLIGNIVKQYELEAKLGIKIIDDYYSMQQYIPQVKGHEGAKMINLSISSCSDLNDSELNPVNRYIYALREKYWSLFFRSNEISSLLVESARNKYLRNIRDFRCYDFTFSNIKQLEINIVQNLNKSIDEAILDQFDNFTYKYSLDKNSNVHYFNGWQTNSAFMIKPKVIVPMYGIYSSRWSSGWDIWKCRDYLDELEKIFTYLDGGLTQGDTVKDILGNYQRNKTYDGGKVTFKYFDVEFKKKGTIHIWFTNENLLKKFNIFGCQKHNWLPNCYGKKAYGDMTQEEQKVIDSFEGKASYDKVLKNPQVYLSGNQVLQIAMNK